MREVINLFKTRPGRQISILFFLTTIIIGLVYLLQYGRVVVIVESSGDKQIEGILVNSDKQRKPVKLVRGENKIFTKNGAYQLIVDQGPNQTLGFINVKPFLLTTKQVAIIKPESKVAKIGSQSMGCGGLIGSDYYSYDCHNATQIFKHSAINSPPFSENIAIDNKIFTGLRPAKESFIGISENEEELILRKVNPSTQTAQQIILPSGLESPRIVASGDPGVGPVGIYDSGASRYFIYKSFTDPNPIEINPKRDIDFTKSSLSIINGYLTGDELVVYARPPLDMGDSDHKKYHDEVTASQAPGVILVYSTNTGKLTGQIKLPKGLAGTNMFKVDPKTLLFTTNDQKILVLNINKNKANITYAIPKSKTVTIYRDRVYYQSDEGGIYRLNPAAQTASRLYESSYLSLSSMNVVNENTLLFTAYPGDTAQDLPGVYKLEINKPAVYPRPEWYLPYIDNETVRQMDYSETTLRVALALESHTLSKTSGNVSYDQREFENKKQRVLDVLRRFGLSDRFEIIFIPDTYTPLD